MDWFLPFITGVAAGVVIAIAAHFIKSNRDGIKPGKTGATNEE